MAWRAPRTVGQNLPGESGKDERSPLAEPRMSPASRLSKYSHPSVRSAIPPCGAHRIGPWPSRPPHPGAEWGRVALRPADIMSAVARPSPNGDPDMVRLTAGCVALLLVVVA